MAGERDKDVLLEEYGHMWRYYNQIHDNNQKLYDNFFRAVSVFGAVVAISAAVLNVETIDIDVPFQMLLVSVAAIGILGLGFVGHNSILTFSRDVGNSQIYLVNMTRIRTYLYESTPEIVAAELPRIDDLRRPKVETGRTTVSDARILIFVALNALVFAVGLFVLLYSASYGVMLALGGETADMQLVGMVSIGALVVTALLVPVIYLVERRAAFSARDSYFQQRIGSQPTIEAKE